MWWSAFRRLHTTILLSNFKDVPRQPVLYCCCVISDRGAIASPVVDRWYFLHSSHRLKQYLVSSCVFWYALSSFAHYFCISFWKCKPAGWEGGTGRQKWGGTRLRTGSDDDSYMLLALASNSFISAFILLPASLVSCHWKSWLHS